MTKIIALDVGRVRVGVATSDTDIKIPFSHAIWPRAASRAEREIIALIKELVPVCIVVGMPLSQNGTRNQQCEQIEKFVARILKRIPTTVEYIDESHSSLEAQEILHQQGNRTKDDDTIAACLILERYFELHSK